MFKTEQFRAQAEKYRDLGKSADGPDQVREFQLLEYKFAMLADNEQWLAENHTRTLQEPTPHGAGTIALAAEEEHILRCLGAALIMQWSALPLELQRELFDNAGSMGHPIQIAELRGQIARFLHKQTADEC
jgi:hypothetical protein